MMLEAAIEGFALGFSLILAIGAQNAFILRQGLLRQHVLMLVSVCALSDAVLIAAGVLGLGSLIRAWPSLVLWATAGGIIFLAAYGLFALLRALKPGQMTPDSKGGLTWQAALATVLAFTFLNPHVYLDTVIMMGSISARYDIDARLWFGIGGASASFVFFFSLGYGARLLAPFFARPASWRVLDLIIAAVMWGLAVMLFLDLRTFY